MSTALVCPDPEVSAHPRPPRTGQTNRRLVLLLLETKQDTVLARVRFIPAPEGGGVSVVEGMGVQFVAESMSRLLPAALTNVVWLTRRG